MTYVYHLVGPVCRRRLLCSCQGKKSLVVGISIRGTKPVDCRTGTGAVQTAKICPQCQQKVAAGSRFCNQCGYAFPVAEQATAAAETTRETDSEKTTEAQQ